MTAHLVESVFGGTALVFIRNAVQDEIQMMGVLNISSGLVFGRLLGVSIGKSGTEVALDRIQLLLETFRKGSRIFVGFLFDS
jgi:hypothetical protein